MKTIKFPPEEKMRIVVESLPGEKSISQIYRENGVSITQYYKWNYKFIKGRLSTLSGANTVKQNQAASNWGTGRVRSWLEKRENITINRKTLQKIMRERNLLVKVKKKIASRTAQKHKPSPEKPNHW